MRQFLRPACLIAALLAASALAPAAGAAPGAGSDGGPALQSPDDSGAVGGAAAPSATAAPTGSGSSAAAPEASSAPPGTGVHRRADAGIPVGHFRVFEHPPCAGDPCQATVGELDGRQGFEAAVSLGPMHLARPLEEAARSGQIDLLLSGELHRGPGEPRLQALHLEGVTPHAPDAPTASRAGRARSVPDAERSHMPVPPARRLLRA